MESQNRYFLVDTDMSAIHSAAAQEISLFVDMIPPTCTNILGI
jgi:hypothetical protein